MAKNKKGIEKKEYPKLIKVGDKKVRVLNEDEEKKYTKKQPAAAWGKSE